MTDALEPLSDEDLSAALDGYADPSVLERLQRDQASQQRYRRLEAARDLLRSEPVTPLPSSTVDDLVARALAEVGGPATTTSAPEGGAVVAPFTSAGRRRSGPPLWAMAAVVAALVAVGLTLVWNGRNDDNGDTVAGPPTTVDAGDVNEQVPGVDGEVPDRHDASPGDTSSPPTLAPSSGVPAAVIDLGEFDSKDDLRAALADGLPDCCEIADPDLAPSNEAVARCETQLATLMQSEGIEQDAGQPVLARVAGTTYLAYEFELTEPTEGRTSLISVVEPASCNPAFTFFR